MTRLTTGELAICFFQQPGSRSPRDSVGRYPIAERQWESHYVTSQSLIQLPDGSWRIWYASRTRSAGFGRIKVAEYNPTPIIRRQDLPNLERFDLSDTLSLASCFGLS